MMVMASCTQHLLGAFNTFLTQFVFGGLRNKHSTQVYGRIANTTVGDNDSIIFLIDRISTRWPAKTILWLDRVH